MNGLLGSFQDKTRDMAVLEHPSGEAGSDLELVEETDRVYGGFWGLARSARGADASVEVSPVGASGGLRVSVRARGTASRSGGPAGADGKDVEEGSDDAGLDVVVWNPWVDKSKRMEDFGDSEFESMVCVEPGRVSKPFSLPPGGAYELE